MDDERETLVVGTETRVVRTPAVQAPAARDGTAGFVLSRALEAHGRPVAFAFTGAPPDRDGSEVTLTTTLLRKSLNYKSLAAGTSYPLFHDTLFADLRGTFTSAALRARNARRRLWREDVSMSGTTARDQSDLETNAVVFPKLFRRLTTYLAARAGDLGAFLPWLKKDEEQVLDLMTGNFTHFDNMLRVSRGKIRMTQEPETIVFVSAKTTDPSVAPWIRH